MSQKNKIYVSLALCSFGATMFCMGSAHQKPVATGITIVIALFGAVFSILARIIYNKEHRKTQQDSVS